VHHAPVPSRQTTVCVPLCPAAAGALLLLKVTSPWHRCPNAIVHCPWTTGTNSSSCCRVTACQQHHSSTAVPS
jgi:hypothetical protein